MSSLHKIYQAFRTAVITYPTRPRPEARPETFAVLWTKDDLLSDTLGFNASHVDTPYFFSRAWAQTKHNPSNQQTAPPVVGVADISHTMSKQAIQGKKTDRVPHTLQLFAVDVFYEKPGPTARERRSVHEIQRDTDGICKTVLQYVLNCELFVGDSGKEYFAPKELMDVYVANGVETGYQIDPKNRIEIVGAENDGKGGFGFQPYNTGVENYYGTLVNFELKYFQCHPKETEWRYAEYMETYDKGLNN